MERINESGVAAEADRAIEGGHLLCCTSRGSLPCQWCDWAVVTQSAVDLIARIDDTRRLLNESPSARWWTLAAWSLQEPMESTGLTSENVVRPEVDFIWRGLERALLASQAELSELLAHASGADGEL